MMEEELKDSNGTRRKGINILFSFTKLQLNIDTPLEHISHHHSEAFISYQQSSNKEGFLFPYMVNRFLIILYYPPVFL
ncbi:hypothetical protein AQUCO_00900524v1 [Aquilegia coerulea]|uniref:Uncharacterized protein n=1 Tax=Aquilegia coerulea TaxID=218851 RepID=A0A2G5EE22_AQUCA|nr:hypothetical protein AQUCO_00900524v1 [Aquilegia coerulea]